MKKQIFAVCDLEEEYARNFMEYLNQKKNLPFEVQAFTNVESLLAYGRENHIELLLISAQAMCREVEELNTGKTMILTEGTKPEEFDAYAGVFAAAGTCSEENNGDTGCIFACRALPSDIFCTYPGTDSGAGKVRIVSEYGGICRV